MYAGAKGMLAHYGGLISKAIDGLAVKPNLDKAQKLQPNSPGVLFGLGSFYLLAPGIAGGDKAKAQNFLNQAIQADPLFADVYVRLGQLAKIKGDQEKYNLYLQKALEIDPQNELAQDVQSGRCKFICVNSQD
jgi:tetratricopeptide (TPR) repeat protein